MISNDSLVCYFAPGSPAAPQGDMPLLGKSNDPTEPKSSFFRGVAVGLGVVVPLWAWVVLSIIH